MATVYVIKSLSTNKLYTGCTSDLQQRLDRHNGLLPSKKSSYTRKQKGPWIVVYSEICQDMSQARKRELQLKSSRGREFIKNQIRP
ncbi:MAG: GIY-YIG nuclease family protein [Candidatus Paceibacterota bacterium]|jgi:putative endonuclease